MYSSLESGVVRSLPRSSFDTIVSMFSARHETSPAGILGGLRGLGKLGGSPGGAIGGVDGDAIGALGGAPGGALGGSAGGTIGGGGGHCGASSGCAGG